MARLLSPLEFGLIGMITFFIALSNSLVDSGFSQALIRKQDCNQDDYSTVFYFNLIAGLLLYVLLYFCAPSVSRFYEEPRLTPLLRVQGCIVLVNALTLIQRTVLIKRIDFKLQTKISFTASLLAAVVGITLAYKGFGVWSLVWNAILMSVFTSLFLWIFNRWRPALRFSVLHLKEHFHFGYKLLLSGLLDTAWRNIYLLIIGKYFTAEALGYYSRADMFKQAPSSNITGVVQRVSYPVLSQVSHDSVRLRAGYHKMIVCSSFITFVLMIGMAAVAESMIVSLLGTEWKESVWMLQIICFAGMLYPLHALNLNILNVMGRSDLFLKLEVIKKTLAVPVIILGVRYGIHWLLFGMVFNSFIALFLNSYWSGKLISYSTLEQMKDILPSFLLSICMAATVYVAGTFMTGSSWIIFVSQIFLGGILTLFLSELTRNVPYIILKEIALEKLRIKPRKA
jgi:teichuronic acid exporter